MIKGGTTRIDKLMTDFAVGYKRQGFITDDIAKVKKVENQSDKYIINGAEQFLAEDDKIAFGGEVREVYRTLSSDQYYCDGHGLEEAIDRLQYKNYDPIIRKKQDDAVPFLMGKIQLNKEIAFMAKLADDANFAAAHIQDVGGDWDDDNAGDPLGDIDAMKTLIMLAQGITDADVDLILLLGQDGRNALRRRADIREQFKYTAAGLPKDTQLAEYLGVREVKKMNSVKNTAKRGAAKSLSFLLSNQAFLIAVPQGEILTDEDVSAWMVQFRWTGGFTESEMGTLVTKYSDEKRGPMGSEITRAQQWYDLKVVNIAAAAKFKNIITP